jgi:hypothetical protein
VVRRCPRPRRRPVRVPADLGRPGQHAVVPQACSSGSPKG